MQQIPCDDEFHSFHEQAIDDRMWPIYEGTSDFWDSDDSGEMGNERRGEDEQLSIANNKKHDTSSENTIGQTHHTHICTRSMF